MGNVPTLRFSQFSGEWEEKKLVDIIDFKSGYAFSSSDMSNDLEKYQLIKMSNIYQNVLSLDRSPSYWKELKDVQKDFLLQKGDIVLTLTGTVGKRDYGYSAVIPKNDKFLLNQRLVRLRAKTDKSLSSFVYNIVLSERFLYHFFSNSKGGTGNQSNVSIEDLKQIKFPLPLKQEQEKIASFLSTVDKKIEKLEEKIALQEKYKKAMMQKIFSQEIRFKADDGSDFPAWEEKKLGDISKITMGQSPDSKSYNNNANGLYLIQGNADIKNRKSNPRNWTSEPTKECNIGDLLLTVRAPVGAIAKSYHNACIGRGVCAISNNKYSDIEYLYQYLLWFEKRWISLEQGSTFTAVSSSDIKTLKIPYPSLKEQQKIANFLSSLDKKIEATKKQKQKAVEFKKGLLQQMFV